MLEVVSYYVWMGRSFQKGIRKKEKEKEKPVGRKSEGGYGFKVMNEGWTELRWEETERGLAGGGGIFVASWHFLPARHRR